MTALSMISTEIGLIFLSLGALITDLFIKNDAQRGKRLANLSMIGVWLLIINLIFQWGRFGSLFHGSFVQDGVSFYFKLIFLLAGFFTVFMAREYQNHLKRGHGEFILLILFSLVGMTFLVSANDFLLFFVSLEILTICLYVMTSYLTDNTATTEAGVKYLILGALSTAVFLYGLSFVYGAAGSTSFSAITQKFQNANVLPAPFLFGILLIISSLAFKIAAVPFQLWAPDIYEGAPTPVTAFLAIGSKAAGFAGLTRLMLTVFSPAQNSLTVLFAGLAALTILYGNLGAIPQTNIKRLMGYSSIGHAGYLLLGLATFHATGNEALLYYLASYLFSTGGVFLVLIALSNHLKTHQISELAGLSKKSPLLAASLLISLLSLAGVPPLAGFFAKFYLLWATVKAGFLWLALIGVLNVITSLYYYLKIVKVAYVDKPADTTPYKISFDQKVIQYLSIFTILFLGIYQEPVVHLAKLAFSSF